MPVNYTQEELDSGLNTEVDAKILADRKNGTIVIGTKATDQLINSYKRKIIDARRAPGGPPPGGSENGPLYRAIEAALEKGKTFRGSVKGKLAEIKTAIDGIPTIIANLKQEKGDAEARIVTLTDNLKKQGDDALADKARQITELNRNKAELEQKLIAADQKVAQSNTQTKEFATEKAAAKTQIAALQTRVAELTAKSQGNTAKDAEELAKLNTAINERDGLQSQLTTIEGAQAKILKMINEYGTSDDADRAAIITTLKTQLGALQSIMQPQTRGGKQSSKRKYKGKGSKKKKYRGGFVYNKSTTTSSPNTTSPNTTSPNTTSPNTTSSPNTSSSSTPGDDFGRGVTKKKKRRANSKKSGTRKKQKKSKVGTKQKKTAVRKHGKKCPVTKRRKKRCAK